MFPSKCFRIDRVQSLLLFLLEKEQNGVDQGIRLLTMMTWENIVKSICAVVTMIFVIIYQLVKVNIISQIVIFSLCWIVIVIINFIGAYEKLIQKNPIELDECISHYEITVTTMTVQLSIVIFMIRKCFYDAAHITVWMNRNQNVISGLICHCIMIKMNVMHSMTKSMIFSLTTERKRRKIESLLLFEILYCFYFSCASS